MKFFVISKSKNPIANSICVTPSDYVETLPLMKLYLSFPFDSNFIPRLFGKLFEISSLALADRVPWSDCTQGSDSRLADKKTRCNK